MQQSSATPSDTRECASPGRSRLVWINKYGMSNYDDALYSSTYLLTYLLPVLPSAIPSGGSFNKLWIDFTKFATPLKHLADRVEKKITVPRNQYKFRHKTNKPITFSIRQKSRQQRSNWQTFVTSTNNGPISQRLTVGFSSKLANKHTQRVSKNKQNCFCHNFAKFPPTLIIFGTKMANSPKLTRKPS